MTAVSTQLVDRHLRPVLENLFAYYVYDMSDFLGYAPNSEGKFSFRPDQLDPYWDREDHKPYFLFVESELAGFALIRRYPANKSVLDVDQFFVLRKFKGKGIGTRAIRLISDESPGEWQIRVLLENDGALRFWKQAVHDLVGDDYSLAIEEDEGLPMSFLRFCVH